MKYAAYTSTMKAAVVYHFDGYARFSQYFLHTILSTTPV